MVFAGYTCGMESTKIVARFIRKAIDAAGLKDRSVAVMAGISAQNLADLLSGIHAPKFETVRRLCVVLEIDWGDLLEAMPEFVPFPKPVMGRPRKEAVEA